MNKTVATPEVAPDTAHSAIIGDHPYEPKDPKQPWSLCKHCNLAESTHMHTTQVFKTAPPAEPPKLPPHAHMVEKGEPEPDDDPNPLPVAEIHLSVAEEHMVKRETETTCWRCGKAPGRLIPENGAYLCATCETILKP